jgi:hypothetical protein
MRFIYLILSAKTRRRQQGCYIHKSYTKDVASRRCLARFLAGIALYFARKHSIKQETAGDNTMTAELYKIVVTPKDEITGLGVARRELKKAYTYEKYGRTWVTTNKATADRHNQEELRRVK